MAWLIFMARSRSVRAPARSPGDTVSLRGSDIGVVMKDTLRR
jgi:hypothetical protein